MFYYLFFFRSKSGRRNGDDQEKNVEYVTSVGNPNLPLLSQLLTTPHFVQTTQYKSSVGENVSLNASHQGSSQVPLMSHNTMKKAQDKLSFGVKFVESPNISVGTDVDMPKPVTQSSFTTPYVCNISQLVTSTLTTEPVMKASTPELTSSYCSKPELVNMDYLNTLTSANFMPSSSSSVISSSSGVSQRICQGDFNQISSSESFKNQPIDLFLSTSGSDNTSAEMLSVTSAMSDQSLDRMNNENFGNSPSVGTGKLNTLGPDEDSLLDLLSLDVMDVGTVMKFFNDDNHS